MAGQALYRRWRSQSFDEIVGQEHVTRALRNALRDGRLAHAYLFAGPRGTGKTSTARILAKTINCLAEPEARPCNRCAICQAITEGRLLDLIEIDAASNTSVDDVRDLREKVGFRPSEARMKLYIIDEVHMLSNSAFNALLKTLEEPPPHVVFVLCTTEPHRIPATVLSRCQRFDFHRISSAAITDHLKRIAEAEGYTAEPEALALIARAATGSMRDAVSLLDQMFAYGDREITAAHARSVLGMVSDQKVGEWLAALAKGDVAVGLVLLNRLVDEGVELRELARQTLSYLREVLLIQAGGDSSLLDIDADTFNQMRSLAAQFSRPRLVQAIRLFSQAAAELRTSLQPQLPLELAFIEAAALPAAEPMAVAGASPAPSAAGIGPRSSETPPLNVAVPEPQPARSERRESPERRSPTVGAAGASGQDKLQQLRASWNMIRQELQMTSPAAGGVLSSRRGVRFLAVEGQEVIIGYQEQGRYSVETILRQPAVVAALERALENVFGSPHTVRYVPEEHYRPSEKTQGTEALAGNDIDPLVKVAASELGARVEKLSP